VNQTRTARDRLDRVFAIARRTGRFAGPALVVALVGGALTAGYVFGLHHRVYKSEAVLRYRDTARAAELGGDDPDERAPRLAARLREAGLSRVRLEQIITASKIYGDIIADRGMPEAVDEMRRHVDYRALDGETFGVSFETTDATRARDVTARIADALVADSAHVEGAPVEVPHAAVDRERLEKDLKDKQAALTGFLGKHPEFTRELALGLPPARPRPAPANGNDPTLASLDREVQRLQERLAQPTKTGEAAQAEASLVAAKSAADNELAAAQKDLADKQAKYTEEHPDVRAAREKLKAAQDKSRHADEAVNASLAAAQARAAAKQEDEGYIDRGALENQLKRIQDEVVEYKRHKAANAAAQTQFASQVVALEGDWTRLSHDVSEARERLQGARSAEAASAGEAPEVAAAIVRSSPLVLIDPAYVPGHEQWPGRTPILVAGVATSLVLALLLAILMALLDDRIYDRVDIERLGVPLLSVVPRRAAEGGGKHG